MNTAANAATDTSTSYPTVTQNYDRYGNLVEPIEVQDDIVTDDDLPERSKEEIDKEEFNGTILDTVIYVIGGLAGVMVVVQITGFILCRMFPSFNEKLGKLKFLGITGYEDSVFSFCIKVGLLGMLSYFSISGMLKRFLGWIFGLITNILHIGG